MSQIINQRLSMKLNLRDYYQAREPGTRVTRSTNLSTSFLPPRPTSTSSQPSRLLRLHFSRHLPPGPPRPRSLLTELLHGRLWDLFTGLGLGQSALDNKEDTDFWLSGHLPSACLMINCVYLQLKLYIILTSLSL